MVLLSFLEVVLVLAMLFTEDIGNGVANTRLQNC
jgi:hypothetical protein